MAVTTLVFRPKPSARLAAQLNSPPETWISVESPPTLAQRQRVGRGQGVRSRDPASRPAVQAASKPGRGAERSTAAPSAPQRSGGAAGQRLEADSLKLVALRAGMWPASSRWTMAPTAAKSVTPSPAGIIVMPMSVISSFFFLGASLYGGAATAQQRSSGFHFLDFDISAISAVRSGRNDSHRNGTKSVPVLDACEACCT